MTGGHHDDLRPTLSITIHILVNLKERHYGKFILKKLEILLTLLTNRLYFVIYHKNNKNKYQRLNVKHLSEKIIVIFKLSREF